MEYISSNPQSRDKMIFFKLRVPGRERIQNLTKSRAKEKVEQAMSLLTSIRLSGKELLWPSL